MAEKSSAVGLLLSDDLLFASRITATARALGLTIRPARSVQALCDLAQQVAPTCVLVDLSHSGLNIAYLVARLRETVSPMPRVVAYGSHVDTATLRTARDAGCDPVLPRSKFVDDLEHALPGWLA
jgi:DNA-binding NarL/FixJ family response regulator